jgi:hypothetical protein
MTKTEQYLWTIHLKNDGFEIDNPREIFEPFNGESCSFLNEDVGTQELRIRVWNWIDSKNQSFELIDINAWPGDNESGIISIDGIPVISNGDQDLSWISKHNHEFQQMLDLFREIRINCHEDDRDTEDPECEAFFTSDAGQQAIKLEKTARDKYLNEINDIRTQHTTLRDKYLPEFSLIDSLPINGNGIYRRSLDEEDIIEEIIEIADEIGYQLKKNYWNTYDSGTKFTFIQWKRDSGDLKLVTINENHRWNTFLLGANGKLHRQIYKQNYLCDDYDLNDPILCELAPRIHSYFEILYPSVKIL